ncbi:MAG: radical SAM protein [Candidatus Eisenbacteria bacterium]
MSDIDVLIVGGYSLTEVAGGTSETLNKMRLHHNGHLATVDFLKCLVDKAGDLDLAEKQYAEQNKSRLVSRSLNTIYLYDFLTKYGIRTEAVNYFLLEQDKFKRLMAAKPRVVAISTTFMCHTSEVIAIAQAARELSPGSVILAGGIKVLKSYKTYTLFKQGYLEGFDMEPVKSNNFFFDASTDNRVDALVIEECGELTLLRLVRKIKNGEDYRCTPNIAYRKGNHLVFTKRVREPSTFDQHAISWDRVPESIIGNAIPVKAGMGCPFRCAFCDFWGLHRVQSRPIECVIEELKTIQDVYPGKPVEFTDDNLFTTPSRIKQLCKGIIENGLDFKWGAFVRTDAITEDNVEMLAKAGCFVCALGTESGDNGILKNMNKETTRDQNLKAVHFLSKHLISTTSTVIVGFPGETEDSVAKTIDLLNSYPDVSYPVHRYYPFAFLLSPLTPIASPGNRRRYGITGGTDTWSHSTMDWKQANDQVLRMFSEVGTPTLRYSENPHAVLPATKITATLKTRDNIVKSGITVISDHNADSIYQMFRPIFEEREVCHVS